MRVLVVDSHNDQSADARLPRVLAALGCFQPCAAPFASVRRPSDGQFHDLGGYDLALVHESDARLDSAAFLKVCVRSTTPCVLFSGGTDRPRAGSERLLYLADSDILSHAEEGMEFWRATGRLDLTAWTQGLAAARRAEVNRLCEPLRAVLRAPAGENPPVELDDIIRLPQRLMTCSESQTFHHHLAELAAAIDQSPKAVMEFISWAREVRAMLMALLGKLVNSA